METAKSNKALNNTIHVKKKTTKNPTKTEENNKNCTVVAFFHEAKLQKCKNHIDAPSYDRESLSMIKKLNNYLFNFAYWLD